MEETSQPRRTALASGRRRLLAYGLRRRRGWPHRRLGGLVPPKPGRGEQRIRGRRPRPETGAAGRRAAGRSMFADAPGTRAYAAPWCENDAGGRFTNRPSGDSRRAFCPSACAVVSCGLAAPPRAAGRAAPVVAGATPLAEGSVRHSAERVFTPSTLADQGLLPNQVSLREGDVSAALRRRRTRCPASWPPGCPASPTRTGTRPFRLAVLAFPHGIAGPGATPREGGMACTSQPSPCRMRHAE